MCTSNLQFQCHGPNGIEESESNKHEEELPRIAPRSMENRRKTLRPTCGGEFSEPEVFMCPITQVRLLLQDVCHAYLPSIPMHQQMQGLSVFGLWDSAFVDTGR